MASLYADDPEYWQGLLCSALGLYSIKNDDRNNRFEEDEKTDDSFELQKSVSVDRSFPPTSDDSVLRATSIELLEEVIFDTFSRMPVNILCHTLTLRIKTDTFKVITKSLTKKEPILLSDPSTAYSQLQPLSHQVCAKTANFSYWTRFWGYIP